MHYFESLNIYLELRRKTRIKSIHSFLAIENNQLSLFQVEEVINGKAVIGDQKDIEEFDGIYEIKFNDQKECIYFKSWEMKM